MKKMITENTLTEIFGKALCKEDAIRLIMKDDQTWKIFEEFTAEQRQDLLNFFMGQSGLLITYDNFFKKILSPYEHPERLESFLSAVLGEKVKIMEIIEREGQPLCDDSSMVIVDLLIEIGDHKLVNLEMQKIGLYFPGERSEVYAADLIMRQYTRMKNLHGKRFQYEDMPPVYIIILMDKSSGEFLVKNVRDHYIHRRNITYDSGVNLKALQNITYISLDTFRKKLQNEGISNIQDAWLTFFSSARAQDILTLIDKFPQFREYYHDIAEYRRKPEEVIRMYSEMIAFLDKNTINYMVEDMTNQVSVLKEEKKELEAQKQTLEVQKQQLEAQKQQLEAYNQDLEAHNQDLEAHNQDLEAHNQDLEAHNQDLETKFKELQAKYQNAIAENQKLKQSSLNQ